MASDMDIEMDNDMGRMMDEDTAVVDVEVIQTESISESQSATNIAAPNDSIAPDALEPTPHKVHLRGLDNLTTKDIKDFASEYFTSCRPSHVEWIDDTSANLVYETAATALEALIAFSALEISDVSQIPALQTIAAKPFPLHPETNLEIRIAVLGDRKQPGARDRSRFYLFNPKYDPAERRKREGPRGGNKYRDRDHGDYRSRRYDDREQRKRQNDDEAAGFNTSLYDDDEAALAVRRRDSSSPSIDSRGRNNGYQNRSRAVKELFPDNGGRGSGRLRNRSASPAKDVPSDRELEARAKRQDLAAAANRQKAQLLKAQLRASTAKKELFPAGIGNRRSDAFDATDATADLFARRMSVPFLDEGKDYNPTAGLSLASRITRVDATSGRLNIRGAANELPVNGISIRGLAGESNVKELFPSSRGNAGKELFSKKLEGRGGRRQKAEDLFY